MPEQALIIQFTYGSTDLARLYALEDELESAIGRANAGDLDGHEIAIDGSHGTFFIYGPSADELLKTVEPILKKSKFMEGAKVTRRYGPPVDGVHEVSSVIAAWPESSSTGSHDIRSGWRAAVKAGAMRLGFVSDAVPRDRHGKAKPFWRRWYVWVVLGLIFWSAMALSGPPTPPDVRTVLTDGHRVSFRVLGTGRPAVVMISGLGDGMATFDGVATELAKTRTVILYDRAGYGGSERANVPRDAEAAARELSGLLAQSGVEGPYVVAGHSLGGLFAEYYAATHPDDVAGLILEETRPADFSRRCAAALGERKCLPPSWVVWFMAQGARDEAEGLGRTMDQVERIAPVQGKPVLVLSQPERDAEKITFATLWTEAQADLAARYEGSRHLPAESGGHYLHYDQRDWFIASVQAFLDEIR